jgi:hypothetical protein
MTEALIVPSSFGGKHIRVIEKDGEVWMPCKDLSIALGLDRTALHQHVKRNRDFFGETAIDGDILSPDGDDYWVNELGLYLLLGRVSLGKVSPDAKVLISQFRQNVPVFLKQYRKKEIVPVQQPVSQDLDEVISYDLVEAKQIAELTGADPKVMQAAILRKHGYPELAAVLAPQNPEYVHGETGWYNPSGLVELCNDPGLTPERLNQFLANYREDGEWRPFQYREGKIWRLTKRGMQHGREYQFNLGNGHSEPRISWRESILYAAGLKKGDLEQHQRY